VLFGKRISENTAIKTYREFESARILTPKKILQAGWDRLVELLDAGGYVRYDFSTATRLLEISKELLQRYGERPLTTIQAIIRDNNELEQALQSFKGIGPVTTNIFLRELRTVWEKANPEPLPIVKKIARKFSIDLDSMNRKTEKFMRLEVALIRLRRQYKD
jgi:endonuclease III